MSQCSYCGADFVSGQPCRTLERARRCPESALATNPAPFVEFGDGWAKIHFRRTVTENDRAILAGAMSHISHVREADQ